MECTKYFRYRELFRTGKGANRALMEAALWWSRSINRFLVRVEIYDKSAGRLITVVALVGGQVRAAGCGQFHPLRSHTNIHVYKMCRPIIDRALAFN